MTVVSTVGGLGLYYLKRELGTIRNQSASGGRTALATILNSYITNPLVLHASLFSNPCVQAELGSENPNLNSSSSTCLVTHGSAGQDGFVSFALHAPAEMGLLLTGTKSAPARYTVNGDLCNAPSDDCSYEVFTEAQTNGVSVIEYGVSKPAVRIRYFVRNQNQVSSGETVAAYTFQGEATVPFERVNRRNDPTNVPACKDIGGNIANPLKGWVQLGAVKNVAWPNKERPVCVPGIGTRVCPGNTFQVGLNAAGDPICRGSKAECPPGRVQYGYEPSPDGGVQPKCVISDCKDRAGRFGFLRPDPTDNLSIGVGCLPIKPKSGCENRIKTTIGDAGDLGC